MDDGKLTVRAVERALDILLCFTNSQKLSLTEIASRVGLHKSTVHRLLASLEHKGFVQRDSATDRYGLGFSLWELSMHLSEGDDLGVMLLPEMERLRDLVGETVSLYLRDGMERVRIQAVQSSQAIRRVAPVGARMPLYVGASSKVLTAYEDEAVQEQVLHEAERSYGIDRESYMQQLRDIRTNGYATSVEEREPGAAAIAVPILDRSDRLIAALAVSGPANRLTVELMLELVPAITESARRMGIMQR